MYAKKILIFNNADSRFAISGKQLCGMVKLINNGQPYTEGSLVVTNADEKTFGEWWLLLSVDGEIFAYSVTTLDRFAFTVDTRLSDNVGCALIKREQICRVVAVADVGVKVLSDYLRVNADKIVRTAPQNGGKYQTESNNTTAYEKFVAATDNYYGENAVKAAYDVDRLKDVVKQRYRSVTEYSDAFERYYATGRGDNYYQSVKREVAKLLVQFPPYYPLMAKFKESFFVRIDFPDTDRFFVMGVLQQKGEVRYICYGLPGQKDNFCDKDFVYVDGDPEGFWMLYQDAVTGQITVWRDE